MEEAITTGRIVILPEQRRNEVLAFVRGGLDDLSVSRSALRAEGWGIPVSGDPSQTIYVWFDALANYITNLGFGSDDPGEFAHWWSGADERIHIVGKGITRFHAVYWPAILLSAGLELPTRVLVHDYLTVDGGKIGKSHGNGTDPTMLVERYGQDALRWWFCRDVPRVGDADLSERGIALRANELADGLGNLVSRVVALRARHPRVDAAGSDSPVPHELTVLRASLAVLPAEIATAVDRHDIRAIADHAWALVTDTNRAISSIAPWLLARQAAAGDPDAAAALDAVLDTLTSICVEIVNALAPVLPAGAARCQHALATGDPTLARSLFPKAPT